MARWISRIVMLLIAAALVGGIVYALLPKPVAVDLGTVCRGPLMVTVDEDGKTRIRDKYVVSAPLSGRLHRVVLKPGDSVKQGETILTAITPTDPSLLDPRDRAQADLRVKRAESSWKQAAPNSDRARVAHEMAQSDLRRIRDLRKRGVRTPEELETASQMERLRSEEYKWAKIAEETARIEFDLAKAALLRTSNNAAEQPTGDDWRLDLRAPISGVVLRVLQESDTVVTAGQKLIELGDAADLEIEIDVLSADAVKVAPGSRVLLEQWGGEKPLEARVRLIEPSGFTKISALGVEEQRVNVIADFTAPRESRPPLGDAFRVEARIVVWENSDVLKAPTSALFRRGEEWITYVVRDSRAVQQAVQVGRSNGLETEILGGLQTGDTLVLHPGDRVKEGMAVTRRP